MYAKTLVTLTAALLLMVADKTATAAQPTILHSVNGHAIWALDTGDVYENHQPYIESTSINAWLDADGTAHGTIVWMDTYNGIYDEHGDGYSGYTWQVDVDTFLVISENEVYVEGTIFHSNFDGDVGYRNGFYVRDGGPGGVDLMSRTPDAGWTWPVIKGEFRVQ